MDFLNDKNLSSIINEMVDTYNSITYENSFKYNLIDNKTKYTLICILPGFIKDNITIVRKGNNIIISALIETNIEDDDIYIKNEYKYIDRKRMVSLPSDATKVISSTFINGELLIEFEKVNNEEQININ